MWPLQMLDSLMSLSSDKINLPKFLMHWFRSKESNPPRQQLFNTGIDLKVYQQPQKILFLTSSANDRLAVFMLFWVNFAGAVGTLVWQILSDRMTTRYFQWNYRQIGWLVLMYTCQYLILQVSILCDVLLKLWTLRRHCLHCFSIICIQN